MLKYLLNTAAAASILVAGSTFAVDPQPADVSCEQLAERYELTAEAEQRFAQLRGTCEGVYQIDGHLFARSSAVVRAVRGNTVRLYLPATDRTIEVTPDQAGRVWIGNRRVRARDLKRGDELGIYISVDRFAQERVTEIAFATEEDHPEPIITAPVTEVAALPTTASSLPLLALTSALMLGAGLVLRRKA